MQNKIQSDILVSVEGLQNKDNHYAYECLQKLVQQTQTENVTYEYFDVFVQMLQADNSYVRTRGLTLIAANAKWDNDNRIESVIEEYLSHINDDKAITARQCVKLLPEIVQYKKQLHDCVCDALLCANLEQYEDSMASLIHRDIEKSLKQIKQLREYAE